MAGEKIVPDTEENSGSCLCPGCPTHNECMKNNDELLFCSRGKTNCDLEKRGCLCGTCPVERNYGLTNFYYCTEGSVKK